MQISPLLFFFNQQYTLDILRFKVKSKKKQFKVKFTGNSKLTLDTLRIKLKVGTLLQKGTIVCLFLLFASNLKISNVYCWFKNKKKIKGEICMLVDAGYTFHGPYPNKNRNMLLCFYPSWVADPLLRSWFPNIIFTII